MEKNHKGKQWPVCSGVFSFLLCLLMVGTHFATTYANMINTELNIQTDVIKKDSSNTEDTDYFKTRFADDQQLHDWQQALCEQIQGEGSVLVKNNGALPVDKGIGVTMFGRSSVDIIYGGTGSGQVDTANAATMTSALTDAGFQVNQAMADWYTGKIQALKDADMDRKTAGFIVEYEDLPSQTRIAEIPAEEVKNSGVSYDGYKDLAIVVIGRSGGEGNDLPTGEFTDGVSYYEVQEEEKELLKYVATLGFDKTVVLINSSNAMGLNWLNDPELDVDACLWIGGPGQYGLNAVADILCGDINPSGRFVDTYSSSTLSSPAMSNFGSYAYTNANREDGTVGGVVIDGQPGDGTAVRYAVYYKVYQEGIYVGYKYYETRYEDVVLGQGNANGNAGIYMSTGDNWNYTEEVDYPFGYGLSYTTFTQELQGTTYDSATDTYTVKVKVTNTGDVAGKEVVQVYGQQPYTQFDRDNGIEKASVQLVGFGKTQILEPQQSEVVEVTVDREELTSYDPYVNKTYILEDGTYYLAIGANAHDALNNILAAKGKTVEDGMDYNGDASKTYTFNVAQTDVETYAYSDANPDVKVTNQFDAANLNHYGDGLVTYLTRNDWQGTYPTTYDTLTATDEMIQDLQFNYEPDPNVSKTTQGSTDTDYTVAMMRGKDYDDPQWDDLLNQMTVGEMIGITAHSGFGSAPVKSVSLPQVSHQDGPQGIKGSHSGATNVAYTSEVVMAATFNTEIMHDVGLSMGEDGMRTNDGITGWYGPAVNIHRTPYGGRNFEYYSEDGFLSGKMVSPVIQGAQEMGLVPFLKHFALNDCETYRQSVATFSNEQAIREIYLKPFYYGVTEGDTHGIMSSYNRVGLRWAGAHKGLLTNVLRDEWGFQGTVLTDALTNNRYWMDYRIGLDAGNDAWLLSGDAFVTKGNEWAQTDGKLVENMRKACHNLLFTYANSTAINGISTGDRIVEIMPAWQIALYATDAVLGILTLASVALFVKTTLKKRDDEQTEREV